jgi:hypothetical protein
MAFGGEEVATSTDADGEEEEVTVGGVRSVTRLPAAVMASKVLEKAGKRAGKGKEVGVELGGLSLESSVPAPAPTAPKSVKGLMRTSTHVIAMEGPEGKVERTLTSWKMADYAYKRDPCPFPTRARGLFTEEVEGKNGEKEYEIIARGYDKFFNVDEVSWTKVSSLSSVSWTTTDEDGDSGMRYPSSQRLRTSSLRNLTAVSSSSPLSPPLMSSSLRNTPLDLPPSLQLPSRTRRKERSGWISISRGSGDGRKIWPRSCGRGI